MLNGIFVFVVLASLLLAAMTGQMEALTQAIVKDSQKAVMNIALPLVGVMAFFLGLMRVVQDAGLLRRMARILGPIMQKLFPSVPADHPAMSAMILNLSSNILGLANAATPFGIKAMEELDKLNGKKGTASNAMVLFLALNTAGLAFLPSGVAALRATLGSADPFGIWFTTLFASGTATVVGVCAALLLARLPRFRATAPPVLIPEPEVPADGDLPDAGDPEPEPVRWRQLFGWIFWTLFAGLLIYHVVQLVGDRGVLDITKELLSFWALPVVVGLLVLYGWSRGVRVYESLVEGAKEGFQVAIRIIPFLVAILVGVGMFRASGGIDLLVGLVSPVTDLIRMPAEALPMAILRPLTGSGAYGVMAEIMSVHGPDSFIGYLVSTLQGSTETTFYVLAVYFGAIGVKRTRHALPACLAADVAGILAAVFIVNLLYG